MESVTKSKDANNLHKAEMAIAFVLRYGVLLCAFIIALGMFLKLSFGHWLNPGNNREALAILLSGKTLEGHVLATSFDEALNQLLKMNPDVITGCGLILLIALPFLRVAMTIAVFLFERDWTYLVITLFVFVILLASLFSGTVL